ncbi:O-antigen ligase family protein [Roseitranquillus sediminis]|uniref:O-antigen ligase family protein n=1 Tax=Roseitranquillus sediminis TaxID=2809051 RepID=UPI001D0CCA89|nr:O-antigen ligase family protein [Roseitranquillus sediminis]MBM9593924.1 O-antigen ligase family protein [Roseitranquillus sediminis]
MTHAATHEVDAPRTGASRDWHRPVVAATSAGLMVVFFVTMIMPVSVDVVGLRLTPLRIFLLLAFVPLFVRLVSGQVGRLNGVDICMMLFCVWMYVTLLVNNGMSRFAYSGISTVELLGGYLVGRCLIRNATDFKLFFQIQLGTMLFLAPFALIDHLTNRQIWSDILSIFGDAKYRGGSSRPRWGLQRVSTGFDHPILYGLYCSLAAATTFYIWRDRIAGALGRFAFVAGMVFMSLSSGALLSVMIQFYLMLWDWITRSKWKLLALLFVVAYVALSVLSNRGPILIFIEELTFSPGTGWTRIHQWNYGTAEVMRNPILGMGLLGGDWERPGWLTSSVDNFWLVIAMRHGLPGIGFLVGAFILLTRRTVSAGPLPPLEARYRTGFMIAFIGLCFTLATVHIWGAVSVYSMCFLGIGVWFAEVARPEPEPAADPPDPAARPAGPAPGKAPKIRRELAPQERRGPSVRTVEREPRDSRPARSASASGDRWLPYRRNLHRDRSR